MANRADPAEILYFVASHLDLHSLEMFSLWDSCPQKHHHTTATLQGFQIHVCLLALSTQIPSFIIYLQKIPIDTTYFPTQKFKILYDPTSVF